MSARPIERISVIGAGAWGTALAQTASSAGRKPMLWARHEDVARAVNERHINALLLPDIRLDAGIVATTDLQAAVLGADAVLLAVPAQALRAIASRLTPVLAPGVAVVNCAKGIEAGTGKLLTEVIAETLPGHDAFVLSGPSFAGEVARGLPTAVTIAGHDAALGAALAKALGNRSFRPYWSGDPLGVALGGAVKNVIAIACGIVQGRKLGASANAALMTRGLAEMMRLGRALGAEAETLMGLAGLGDLALTCNSPQSRNLALGVALGEGRSLAQILAGKRSVVEGVFTATALMQMAARHGVDMPISAAVDAIINGSADIDAAILALLARPLKPEGA